MATTSKSSLVPPRYHSPTIGLITFIGVSVCYAPHHSTPNEPRAQYVIFARSNITWSNTSSISSWFSSSWSNQVYAHSDVPGRVHRPSLSRNSCSEFKDPDSSSPLCRINFKLIRDKQRRLASGLVSSL